MTTTLGAYGMAIGGLDRAPELYPVPPDSPAIAVEFCPPTASIDRSEVHPDGACWPLQDGDSVALDRRRGVVRVHTSGVPDIDLMVHPRLGMICALWARWLGRSAFHAGAFVVDGAAYGVLGDNEHGKSTFVAALAVRDIEILAEDTLIVGDGLCFAGVRCIDLRGDTATRLGLQARVRPARGGTRDRLQLSVPGPPRPLAGWIRLQWGHEVSVARLSVTDAMRAIAAERRWHRAGLHDPTAALDLATRPVWDLERPRDLACLERSVDAVLDLLSRR